MKKHINLFRHCRSRGRDMDKALQRKGYNRQGGFTLLEVILAISILTVGLLGVGAMQISAIYGNSLAGRMTAATSMAEDKLEELLLLEYTLTSTHEYLSEGEHPGGTDASGYTTTWTVVNNSPVPNTKEITVMVTWQDKGLTKKTSLSSYMARS